jgi:ribosomal protein L29
MKTAEIRKLEKAELIQKCNELLAEYKRTKFALKSGDITPENINKARVLKKDIARAKTVLMELSLVEAK